jgi:Fe-S cluster biogenesis protein NfuA/nitrite reductase/ring-hydroxylating ferredoxin subunit
LPSIEKIEGLIRTIENLPDPTARASALGLVQALMEFHGEALDRLMEIVANEGEVGYAIFDRFAADEVVSNFLLLYGVHPVPIQNRITAALESVRPYLQSHGGSVELLGINEGVVHLRLEGSCKTCPSSAVTLKLAIEDAIYAAAPDVVAIEAEGIEEQHPPVSTGFVQIGKATPNGNGNSRHWEEVNEMTSLASGSVALKEVRGRSILFCRLGESLYAYDNNCPGCGQQLQGAYLQSTSLVCSQCGERYDVIRAGRGLDQPHIHLEPLPLLFEQGRPRVALPPQ